MPRFRFEQVAQAKLVVLYYRPFPASDSNLFTPYFIVAEANTSLPAIQLAYLTPGMFAQRQTLCIDVLLKAREKYLCCSFLNIGTKYSNFQAIIMEINLLAKVTICSFLSAPTSWPYIFPNFVTGISRGDKLQLYSL